MLLTSVLGCFSLNMPLAARRLEAAQRQDCRWGEAESRGSYFSVGLGRRGEVAVHIAGHVRASLTPHP